MYYTEFISKNNSNPKKMWEIINSVISTTHINFPLTKINTENSVIDHPSKIANCFNQVFVELVTPLQAMSINPLMQTTLLT